jgi:hypothetical protein
LTGTPVFSQVEENINNFWYWCSPDPSVPPGNFSARYTGWVSPPYSEPYTFSVQVSDGARLWVNNTQILNQWSLHPVATDFNSTPINLTAGVSVPVTLEYYDDSLGDTSNSVQLRWSSPTLFFQNGAQVIIPKRNLFSGQTEAPTPTPQAQFSLSRSCLEPVTIDAVFNEPAWSPEAWQALSKTVYGTRQGSESAYYQTRWDSNYLYLAVSILGVPQVYADSGDYYYEDASVETYFDLNNNKSTTLSLSASSDDFAFVMRAGDGTFTERLDRLFGVQRAITIVNGQGYNFEIAFPWLAFDLHTTFPAPAAGVTYGFDLAVNFDRSGGCRESQLMWNGKFKNSTDSSAYGNLVLLPCLSPTRTPTPSPSETDTPGWTDTDTETPTWTPTGTITPVPTDTPTWTGTETETETETLTPTDTDTETPSPTETETETLTHTETETPAYTHTETETPTPTGTDTATFTPTNTATETPSPTETDTQTPTWTDTETLSPSWTPTGTITPVPTDTPTWTATETLTPTETHTPTPTKTFTPTETPSATVTNSQTATRTDTLTNTPNPSPSSSMTVTPSLTVTATDSMTPTVSLTVSASHTPSMSSTPTGTSTTSSTATSTRTATPTGIMTHTPTPSLTASPTASGTMSPTVSASRTPSPTETSTLSRTATRTSTWSRTRTPSPTPTAYTTPPATATGTPPARPYPDPFTPGNPPEDRVVFPLPSGHGAARLVIADISRRTIKESSFRTGEVVYWDGRDSQGRFVSSGVYIYLLAVDGRVRRGTVTSLR